MTRSELVQKILKKHRSEDLSQEDNLIQAEKCVAIFFDAITDYLAKGCRVELRGFGILMPRQRDLRIGRNPRTGEIVNVDAKIVPFFKAGKYLNKCLNSN